MRSVKKFYDYYEEEKEEEEDYGHDYILELHIKSALIDKSSVWPETGNNIGDYYVIVTDIYEREYTTPMVLGLQTKTGSAYVFPWNWLFHIGFDEFPHGGSLKVEIIRVGHVEDPGTSDGITVMGRVEIPMPDRIKDEWDGREGILTRLVRFDDLKVKGLIYVGMKFTSVWAKKKPLPQLSDYM
ncbi:unnamed protein product [Ilex paraguariensis]|uniref:Uncharacterized protein n=1 Tax=Ilex paraguariensis TaxID=185542 RepID=A0ABC8TVS2_9AQUA